MAKQAGGSKMMTATERCTLPEILNVRQAAALLGVSEHHIRNLCKRSSIRSVKLGREWRIGRDALIRQMGIIDTEAPPLREEGRSATTAETVEIVIRIEVPAELAKRLANTKVIVSTDGRPAR